MCQFSIRIYTRSRRVHVDLLKLFGYLILGMFIASILAWLLRLYHDRVVVGVPPEGTNNGTLV